MKTNARKNLGDFGESTAAKFLKDKAYEIVATNYRCRYGEIDIVARDNNQIVFVEVRTKKGRSFGTPEESVGSIKQSRMVSAAQTYLQDKGFENSDWRIDVVAIEVNSRDKVQRIDVLKNAVVG